MEHPGAPRNRNGNSSASTPRTSIATPSQADTLRSAGTPGSPVIRSSTRSGQAYLPADTGIPPGRGVRRRSAATDVSSLHASSRNASATAMLIPSRFDYGVSATPLEPANPIVRTMIGLGSHEAFTPNDDPFAAPKGMDDWARENLGNSFSSAMEGFVEPLTPPPDPASFFNDMYERTMGEGRHFDTEYGDLFEGRIAPPSTPAMTLTPPPVGFLPPRSTAAFPSTNPTALACPSLDLADEVIQWATNVAAQDLHTEAPRPLCTEPACPMVDTFHLQGTYVHEDAPAANHLETFGQSNPPPSVWQAIHNGCHWVGTQQDADLISRFIEYHAIKGNFFIAPHTNFLWGEEVNTPQAVPGAPVVRLPFPATPLRIDFDASLNLLKPPSPAATYTYGAARGPTFLRCTDTTCPIMEEHGQGMYLHNNQPPRIKSAAFGYSNPPDHVWAALDRVTSAQAYNMRASNSDRWTVTNYQKLHATNGV